MIPKCTYHNSYTFFFGFEETLPLRKTYFVGPEPTDHQMITDHSALSRQINNLFLNLCISQSEGVGIQFSNLFF
jgi:hypothetical protein